MGLFSRFKKAPPVGAPLGPLLRAGGLQVARLGEGRVLVHGARGTAQIIEEGELELVRRVVTFRTAGEHARVLGEAIGLDHEAAGEVEALLTRLDAAGLLEREPERWVGQLDPAPRIERLAVLTHERTELARRCLAANGRLAALHGRRAELTVHDDHPSADAPARSRALFEGVDPGTLAFRYAGRAAKEAYGRALAAASGVDPDLVRFALFGGEGLAWTAGANHNAALLDAAGALVVTMDDDTCGRLRPPPFAPSPIGAELKSTGDSTRIMLCGDAEAALAIGGFGDGDPWEPHERALGQAAALALARAAEDREVRYDDASPRAVAELGALEVGISSVGLAGDSGMGAPFYFLMLEGPSAEHLYADYEARRISRGVVRAAPHLTLTEGPHLMTPHVGFDARRPMPPFFPVQRNADGIMGQLFGMVCPRRLIAHLPAAVEHRPPPRKNDPEQLRAGPTSFYLADLILLILRNLGLPSFEHDPARRLDWLGKQLQALAALPPGELLEWLAPRRRRQLAALAESLRGRLAAADGEPEAWAVDVAAAAERIEASAQSRDLLALADLAPTPPEERLARAQRLLGRFGTLLSSWPALWEAAMGLAARDVRVSAPASSGL